MIVRDVVLAARERLTGAGIERAEAAMDAELLAREVLGWDRARFLAHYTDHIGEQDARRIEALVERRVCREPVSEILGRREFRGLDFEVTREVLTPRPETEIIVEEAVARFRETPGGSGPPPGHGLSGGGPPLGPTKPRRGGVGCPPLRIADVGTGSGCLAVCLAREFPEARVIATDVSEAALAVARRNAARHGVAGRIEFRHASILGGGAVPLDLVVSNPPYVPTGDLTTLPIEVRDYEPRQALDGGPDGLDLVRRLCAESARALTPGGWVIFEFGFGQESGARLAVQDAGLELVAIRLDLQGIPRTAVANRKEHG